MLTKHHEDGLNDVVVAVYWIREANEVVDNKEYEANVYGQYWCPSPDPNNFTPYQDLTKTQVEEWLDVGLNVSQLDLSLDQQIENKVNPPIVQLPLPF